MRRTLIKAACASVAGAVLPLRAQTSSQTPLTIVFPYGAGGAVDALIRTLAEFMAKDLGRPVVVDNRPGANSVIGAEYVSRAKGNPNILLWAAWPTLTTNFALYPNLKFALSDFEPVTSAFRGYTSLSVANHIPANNFRELVAYTKANGGQLPYGALGVGSSPHLLMELGGQVTGLKFQQVIYKGEVQGIQDLLGGHLPAYAGALANQVEHHKAKKLRTIAISAESRLENLPDVPTFKEVGFPDMSVSYWHGVVAPAGVPKELIEQFNRSIASGMNQPSVRARLSVDQRVLTSSPDKFRELIISDTRKWGDLIRSRGIKIE